MVKKITIFITIFGLIFGSIPLFTKNVKANENTPIYNTNIDIPSYDMDNDVWLDGNMISDIYYRYDIIYNGIIYNSFEEIKQAYINEVIDSNTLLYIELNPMYNFILAKLEDQGNGLYYWTEFGNLSPESPTSIKTIIINKNGISYKNNNYNSYWNELLWDDLDSTNNVLGNSLIGYENQILLDYYDYFSGYDNGYADGRTYGYNLGRESGLQVGLSLGETIGYEKGYDVGYDDGQDIGYDLGYDVGYDLGYDVGYDYGLIETDATGFSALLTTVFTGLGGLLAIEILPNIHIGAIIAVPLVFGIIFFILGKRKGD